MTSSEQSCRHEYVRIFQRKFIGPGRRLTVTRGYLPTGFSPKDFSYLNPGAYCFCKTCRIRLHPIRIEKAKSAVPLPQYLPDDDSATEPAIIDSNIMDNIWVDEENTSDNTDSNPAALQIVNVDELQIETIEVIDIPNKTVIVNREDDTLSEDGE